MPEKTDPREELGFDLPNLYTTSFSVLSGSGGHLTIVFKETVSATQDLGDGKTGETLDVVRNVCKVTMPKDTVLMLKEMVDMFASQIADEDKSSEKT